MATPTAPNYLFVNNTGVDVRPWDVAIALSVRTGAPLPEDIADLFVLTVRHDLNGDGSPRGFINWA